MHRIFILQTFLVVISIQRQNVLRFYSAGDLLERMLLVEVSVMGLLFIFKRGIVSVVLKSKRVLARGFFRVDLD
jgi:hypothetical protein